MWRGIFKKANKFFNAILMDTLAITVLIVHSVFPHRLFSVSEITVRTKMEQFFFFFGSKSCKIKK